jgi:hypothetical protein
MKIDIIFSEFFRNIGIPGNGIGFVIAIAKDRLYA